jgi:hypothetical protein
LIKEKEYELENYGPQFKVYNLPEYNKILEDITDIPEKMEEIDNLFMISELRLEEILSLPKNNQNNIFIRSLYFDKHFSKPHSASIIERLYEKIYDGGVLEGYLTVAKSFYDSGFIPEAANAVKQGLESADKKRERADENYLKLESDLKELNEELKVAIQFMNGSE